VQLCDQTRLRRLEVLEADLLVLEPLVQLGQRSKDRVLRRSRDRRRFAGFVNGCRRQALLALGSGPFLLGLFPIALQATGAAAQSGRTFWASSPLRPGAMSNSTT
jgi:hypothetical protein